MALDVSIIIPSLNSPLIAEVVSEVATQIPSDLSSEIVVVGLDEPGLVAGTVARLVSSGQPTSAATARNLGVRASTGQHIIFLDSDCLPEPGWLDVLLSHLREERVAVSGAIRVTADHFYRVAGNIASFHEFTTAMPAGERPFLATYSLALPRRCFDEVGWFDERLPRSGGEDLDFTIRMRRAGYRLHFDPSAVVIHCPNRTTFLSMMRHAFLAGGNSIRVRRRYPTDFAMPAWLFHWSLMLACSPFLAYAATVRAALRNRDVRAHWATLPLMLMSRFSWCLGACYVLLVGYDETPPFPGS